VTSLAELGDFERAQAHAEAEHPLADSIDDPVASIHASQAYGQLQLIRGDPRAALPAFERALAVSERSDTPTYAGLISVALCASHALLGQRDEARALVETVERLSEATRARGSRFYVWFAEARFLLGDHDRALESAMRTHEHTLSTGERGGQGQILRLLGEIAARREPPDADEAEARYREVLAMADELEMRPLQARCHLGLGTLYRRTGRPDEARAELRRRSRCSARWGWRSGCRRPRGSWRRRVGNTASGSESDALWSH
jgi:tetratricopeptide (TPR) repeat protein